MLTLRIARGRSLPLGASSTPDGVNFALFCRHGTEVLLVVYALDEDAQFASITLHPHRNRTGDHWHILVSGLPPAFRYGWRVDWPRDPIHVYNPAIVLLDPASTTLGGQGTARVSGRGPADRRQRGELRSAFQVIV